MAGASLDEAATHSVSKLNRRGFFRLSLNAGAALIAVSMGWRGRNARAAAIPPTLLLTQFGADPKGLHDSSDAFVRAIRAACQAGATLVGDPSHIYRIEKTIRVHESNVTIDLKNALVMGTGVLIFDGDSGIDGDWSKALQNVHVRNVRFGDGRGSSTKAFRFLYCTDSSMANVVRHSYGDTGVEMFMCRRTIFSDITSRGGKDSVHGGPHASGGSIAALMLHCEECRFERIEVEEGPFVFGIQVKGGSGNIVSNCSISRISSGQQVRAMDYGFYNRGDEPWGASPTPDFKHGGYSYPFNGGNWSSIDVRRASNRSQYINCVVENCENVRVAFQTQQFVGGGMTNCRSLNNHGGSSFAVNATKNGDEHDFTISNCESVNATNFGIVVIGEKRSSHSLSGIRLIGNAIKGSGYSGIYAVEAPGLAVSNNLVKDNCRRPSIRYKDAIVIDDSDGAVARDNQIQGASVPAD